MRLFSSQKNHHYVAENSKVMMENPHRSKPKIDYAPLQQSLITEMHCASRNRKKKKTPKIIEHKYIVESHERALNESADAAFEMHISIILSLASSLLILVLWLPNLCCAPNRVDGKGRPKILRLTTHVYSVIWQIIFRLKDSGNGQFEERCYRTVCIKTANMRKDYVYISSVCMRYICMMML